MAGWQKQALEGEEGGGRAAFGKSGCKMYVELSARAFDDVIAWLQVMTVQSFLQGGLYLKTSPILNEGGDICIIFIEKDLQRERTRGANPNVSPGNAK